MLIDNCHNKREERWVSSGVKSMAWKQQERARNLLTLPSFYKI